MTLTLTQTTTYTVANIKDVFEQIAADVSMIARTTRTWQDEYVAKVVADVNAFAENKYLSRVDVVLQAADGSPVRARRYDVNDAAQSWENAGPSGNIWPQTAGATLNLVISYAPTWTALSDRQRDNFRAGLRLAWSASKIDLGYPGLQAGQPARYASGAFGVELRTYERRS